LLAADFALTKANGTSDAIVSVTESTTTPGTYVIVGTAITGGTCRLVPSATCLFESNTLTIVAA
jgi:hypothetical protein